MKSQQVTMRLDPALVRWLTEHGQGILVEGVRRVAKEMQYLEELGEQNPGIPLRGALASTMRMLKMMGAVE